MDGLANLNNQVEIARSDLSAPIGFLPKRIIDITLALSGIILLAPLLVICYLLTITTSSGPALFRHRRVGFNNKPFDCLKFRTMLVDAPERLHHLLESDPAAAREWAETRKLRRDPRITSIGAILRKSSLDELPQLFNVLRGDMSIVGPRPLSVRDALRMEEAWQKRRFSVKPGLTCLWQVSGRSNLSFEQWMELDLEYIDRWSLGLDGMILLRTIPAILLARGAS